VPAKIDSTSSFDFYAGTCGCFSQLHMRMPRSSWALVAASDLGAELGERL